ncbi:MAG TPA: hypothetical protein VKB69_02245, partial [Micromonosporaceae bacterium]|nr:hypothetical protein [Micromonosporaceae bacterium]
ETMTWTDSAGGQHTASYHSGGLWTDTITNPDGTTTHDTYAFAAGGIHLSTHVLTLPDGATLTEHYDMTGGLTGVTSTSDTASWTDAAGTHTLVHHPDGTATLSTTAPDGTTTSTAVDAAGSVAGPGTDVVTHGVDAAGHATTITTHPDGTYDVTDVSGRVSHYTAGDRLDSQDFTRGAPWDPSIIGPAHEVFNSDGTIDETMTWTDSAGGQHTASYHSGGLWTDTITNPDGTTTHDTYAFAAGGTIYRSQEVVTDSDGSQTTTTFDASGNQTGSTTLPPTETTPPPDTTDNQPPPVDTTDNQPPPVDTTDKQDPGVAPIDTADKQPPPVDTTDKQDPGVAPIDTADKEAPPVDTSVVPPKPTDAQVTAPTLSPAAHSLLKPTVPVMPLPPVAVPIVVPMPIVVEPHIVPPVPDPAPELSPTQQAVFQQAVDKSPNLDAMVSNTLKDSADTESTLEGNPKP